MSVNAGTYKMTQNITILETLKGNFEQWKQKLITTVSKLSVMMSTSLDRLCLNMLMKE